MGITANRLLGWLRPRNRTGARVEPPAGEAKHMISPEGLDRRRGNIRGDRHLNPKDVGELPGPDKSGKLSWEYDKGKR